MIREGSEEQLVARAADGELAAYEALVRRHQDHLYAVALRLMGDPTDAQDVVQETLLRGWRGIARFEQRAQFFTWIYRIAINEANRSLERRGRREHQAIDHELLTLEGDSEQQPPARLATQQLQRELERAVRSLPATQRAAVVLRDVEGLSTREAAELVGIREAAFKSRLHSGRLKLRASLGDALLR